MQRALIYFVLGTVASFVINYFFGDNKDMGLAIFYAIAFGSAWGLSYYLDNPSFSLVQKLGISFAAMAILVGVGTIIYNLDLAVPAILKFSTVFVAYYLIASMRSSKSLRS